MLVTVTVIALMPLLFYYFVVRTYTYWTDKGVKQGKPLWLFGDSWGIFFKLQNFSEMIQYVYSQCPGTRYSGIYQFLIPTLVIKDPDLIKQVTVKDFDHFVDHRTFISEDTDPLGGKNLLFLKGQKWREMRAILSPSFTASKMRSMFELISECAENFVQYFLDKNEDTVPMEVKDSCTRYANDVIATTAFGVKVDSMREPDNEFYLMGKDMSSPLSGFLDNLKFFGYFIAPRLYKLLKVQFFSAKVQNFFMDMVDRTIKIREEQGIVRPDMIHLMMEARKGIDTELTFTQQSDMIGITHNTPRKITNEDIAAQAIVFFTAGSDTVASMMSFLSYELATNPDAQEKLRKEIVETSEKCKGKITYEALLKMKYMDMVISETLRKWPNVLATDRVCTKPYTIKPAVPGEKPVHLEKGTALFLPTFSIHRDPRYFPHPERFDPERFNDENKKNINPYTYFPFGVGPRTCIGSRFALLETKVVFFHLLSHFKLVPIERTMIPIQISRKSLSVSFDDGLWIGLKRCRE